MSSIGLADATTRLLSDAELRAVYRTDSLRVAQQLSVASEELQAFLGLDPSELDRQAEDLISRRFSEISRLLPRTLYGLVESGSVLFQDYATQLSPTGHERHLIDAVEFCRYLQQNTTEVICRSEVNWLRFLLSRRFCSIHFVADLVVGGKPRRAIQVFYRTRGEAHGFAWHLGI